MVCSTSASVTSAGKNIYRLLHGSLIFFTVFRAFLETLPGMVLGVAFTVGSSAPSAAGIRTRAVSYTHLDVYKRQRRTVQGIKANIFHTIPPCAKQHAQVTV